MTTPPPSENFGNTEYSGPHNSVGNITHQILERIREGNQESLPSGNAARITTGLCDLDRILVGGFTSGDLAVVAGRPGMGTPWLAFDMAAKLACKTMPSAILSTSYPPSTITCHLLAHQSGVTQSQIEQCRLDDGEMATVAKAANELAGDPLYIDYKPLASAKWLCRRALAMHRAVGGLKMIVIELPEIPGSHLLGDIPKRNRHAMPGLSMEVAISLKGLAMETGAAVILVTGITRNVEKREDKRPLLRDLRDGQVLSQLADQVLLLYREEYYYPETPNQGIAEIRVAATCQRPPSTVRVRFDNSGCRFSDLP